MVLLITNAISNSFWKFQLIWTQYDNGLHVPCPMSHVPCPLSCVPCPVSHVPCPVYHVPSPVSLSHVFHMSPLYWFCKFLVWRHHSTNHHRNHSNTKAVNIHFLPTAWTSQVVVGYLDSSRLLYLSPPFPPSVPPTSLCLTVTTVCKTTNFTFYT